MTGNFATPDSADQVAQRRAALEEYACLEAEIAAVKAAAEREKQLPRQVALNLELKRLRQAYAAARERL